jgi:hypothetical protein
VPLGFEEYVFLVRNLRGVYAPLPSDDHGAYVGWITRRYRYRDIGVASCIVEAAGNVFEGRLGGNPFHVLEPPTEKLREALREAGSALAERINSCLAESLLLSLVYASPLYVTRGSLRELEGAGLVIDLVKGGIADLNSARLHMRIAGYSILDSYTTSVKEAVDCISRGCSPDEILGHRKDFAAKDAKRYWRIAGKGSDPVIAYLDHVHVLVEKGVAARLVGWEERVLLAMPVGFVLDSAIKATG